MSETENLVSQLRMLYGSHPIVMQAADEIQRLRDEMVRAGVSLDHGMSKESVSDRLRETLYRS